MLVDFPFLLKLKTNEWKWKIIFELPQAINDQRLNENEKCKIQIYTNMCLRQSKFIHKLLARWENDAV